MKKIVAGLIAGVLLAGGANAAVTVSSTSYGYDSSFTDALGKVSFDNGTVNSAVTGMSISGSGYAIQSGSNGNGAAPAISTTANDATNYLSVYGGSATLTSTTGATFNTVSLYWGSIDTYNSIDLLDANGNSILGGNLISTANYAAALGVGSGDQTSGATNREVTIYSTQAFSSVKFVSSQAAFELDNVKTSVPEPATWGMMILGFGVIGFALRRRRAIEAQAMLG